MKWRETATMAFREVIVHRGGSKTSRWSRWSTFRKRDCRAEVDENLSGTDAMVISSSVLVLVGAVDLVVFDPNKVRMQLRSDAANQRDFATFGNRRVFQLVANHRFVEEAL